MNKSVLVLGSLLTRRSGENTAIPNKFSWKSHNELDPIRSGFSIQPQKFRQKFQKVNLMQFRLLNLRYQNSTLAKMTSIEIHQSRFQYFHEISSIRKKAEIQKNCHSTWQARIFKSVIFYRFNTFKDANHVT